MKETRVVHSIKNKYAHLTAAQIFTSWRFGHISPTRFYGKWARKYSLFLKSMEMLNGIQFVRKYKLYC